MRTNVIVDLLLIWCCSFGACLAFTHLLHVCGSGSSVGLKAQSGEVSGALVLIN
jgi:hypothetical protein